MTGFGFQMCALCILFAPAAVAMQQKKRVSSAIFLTDGQVLTSDVKLGSQTQQHSRRLRNQLYEQGSKTDADDKKYVPGSDGTYSQNYQDKWIAAVAHHNGWDKAGGFFLDLGAFNGLKCSNSALVEKKFGWKGVCVEARPVAGAFSERNCLLVTRALSKETGQEVTFYGTPGTQLQHINKQSIDRADDKGEVIKTVNVPDLFDCVNSTDTSPSTVHEKCKGVPGSMQIPSFINFISLDIEGQGLNVLKTFPFHKVSVGAWVVENDDNAENNKAADAIFKENGYIRVPVENPGVDKYFVQPQFWDPSLAKKEWRTHPKGAEC